MTKTKSQRHRYLKDNEKETKMKDRGESVWLCNNCEEELKKSTK